MSPQSTSHSIKSEIKENLSVSLPLISSQLIYASSGFVGTALVARLGTDALAASVLVNMVWFSISVLFFGILNSVSILVAHQFGAKNDKAISEIMGQAFILGIIVSILCLASMFMMPLFLRYSTQPLAVLNLAHAYMYSLVWTLPSLIMLIICEQFLAGVNRAKIVLRISVTVVPIEITLIYSLIFGKFGLPKCGIAGIGYGFATTYTCTAIFLIIFLLRSRFFRRYDIWDGIKSMNFVWLKELVRVGLPMGCMNAIEVSGFAVATFWMARFGTTMLAAHQIVMQYLGFAITLVFGMAQAVAVRAGHAVGRDDLSGVRYATYVGLLINSVCVTLVYIALRLFPTLFLSIDLNTHDTANLALIRDATSLLSIVALVIIFDNFRIILSAGALRSLKDTKATMIISFISFWIIGLCCSYALAFHFNFSGQGIWYGLVIGLASGAVIALLRFEQLMAKVDLTKLMKVG